MTTNSTRNINLLGCKVTAPNGETYNIPLTVTKPSRWQPIETAPKDEPVLVVEDQWITVAWWFENKHMSGWDQGDTIVDNPTHWMPLPEPPESE